MLYLVLLTKNNENIKRKQKLYLTYEFIITDHSFVIDGGLCKYCDINFVE